MKYSIFPPICLLLSNNIYRSFLSHYKTESCQSWLWLGLNKKWPHIPYWEIIGNKQNTKVRSAQNVEKSYKNLKIFTYKSGSKF